MGKPSPTFHHQPAGPSAAAATAAAAKKKQDAYSETSSTGPTSSAAGADDVGSCSIPLLDQPETPLLAGDYYDEEANSYDNDNDNADDNSVLPPYRDEDGNTDPEAGELPPPFEVYQPKLKRVNGCDGIVVESCDAHLNSDGEALFRWLKEENRIRPRPQIKVTGTHCETRQRSDKKGDETTTVTDFELLFDVGGYLVRGSHPGLLATVPNDEKAYRGGVLARRAYKHEAGERSIRSWADEYCANTSTLKSFVMRKTVTGHDHTYLRARLNNVVRATNYRGDIDVSFPVKDAIVECYPDNRLSRVRHSKPWRWFFFLTCLWVFAWPALWLLTKRYEVVVSRWFMSVPATYTGSDGVARTIREPVISEEAWVNMWEPAIKRCARAGRQGLVTSDDLRAATEDRDARFAVALPAGPMPTTEGGAAGAVAGVFRAMSDANAARENVLGWGGDTNWSW